MNLNDRVVVVTGAGSGLGRALCIKFVEAGCKVFGVGRTATRLEETAGLTDPNKYWHATVDVQNYEEVKTAIDDVVAIHGRVDFLFNAAAVYPKLNFLEETAQQWSDTISINVNGVANCCKAVLPHMLQSDFGRIYNVGSFADYAPIPNSAAYSCSKGAIHALSKAIAADLKHFNKDIEVHEWVPGHLNTQMSDFTGIDPMISAGWAVGIAQIDHDSHAARVYQNDKELQRPIGLKARIALRVLKILMPWRRLPYG